MPPRKPTGARRWVASPPPKPQIPASVKADVTATGTRAGGHSPYAPLCARAARRPPMELHRRSLDALVPVVALLLRHLLLPGSQCAFSVL